MTRRPINRSPLIPQQQASVEQQAGREEVLAALSELLGASVDPDTAAAVDELTSRFEAP